MVSCKMHDAGVNLTSKITSKRDITGRLNHHAYLHTAVYTRPNPSVASILISFVAGVTAARNK